MSASAPLRNGSVTISLDGSNRSASLPLLTGSIGPAVADIRRLYNDLGIFTFDPGYGGTAACESAITYIDGDEGVLLYRGYPIEQLAEKSTFLEVAYLLMNGELPTAEEKSTFERGVIRHTMLHEQLRSFFNGFRRDAHPMAVTLRRGRRALGVLSTTASTSSDPEAPAHLRLPADREGADGHGLGAQILNRPAVHVPAQRSRVRRELPAHGPCRADRGIRRSPVLARALDRILILHADHEQNASTSTVRLAGSTGANPFACIAAGIASLWGPAHGGANEAVLKMLGEIGNARNIPEFIARVKDKNSNVRLMGFGHRVYKNYDPRAKIMQETCHEVLEELGIKDDPLLDLAMELEKHGTPRRIFRQPQAVSERGFLFRHHPARRWASRPSMFTVLFALARTARLDQPVEGDDRGPCAAHRPAAAGLHRRHPAGLAAPAPARLNAASRRGCRAGPVGGSRPGPLRLQRSDIARAPTILP